MELTSPTSHQEVKLEEPAYSPQLPDSQKFQIQVQAAKSTIWTQKQLYLLASFFFYHSSKLVSDSSRKRWKVFKIMSELIQNRNVNQCRSYTKKLFKTFITVAKINSFFRDSLPRYKKTIEQLKGANSNLYDQPLSSQGISQSQKKEIQMQFKTGQTQRNQIQQQKKQNPMREINAQAQLTSNIVFPQISKRMWYDVPLWISKNQELVNWLMNLHYLNFIMGLQ